MDNTTKQCNDIPNFYGQPDKDTITLEDFLSRIDNSVSAFTYTQEMAYVAFTCSLRGAASCWLQYFTTVNRNNPQEWNSIRPHFFSAFKNHLGYSSATTIASAVDNNVVSHNTDVAFDNKTNINKDSYASTLTNLLDQYVATTEAPNFMYDCFA